MGLTEEKKKGRKRHIVVDVLGCLLSVIVHAANIHDTKGGISSAKRAYERYPSIQKFCADAGYRGTFGLCPKSCELAKAYPKSGN